METQTLETPAVEAAVEAATEAIEPNVEAAENAGKPDFDPTTIPTEIREYFGKQQAEQEKKYADYEKHQQSAREWEGVRNDPRFQQWYQGLTTKAPEPFGISDDQFAAALSDKNQFVSLVNQAAERLLAEKVGPQFQQIQQQNDFQAKVGELTQTVAKYPDFKELDKRGLIEPIIRRYPGNPSAGIPGISFEDAYKLAKHSTMSEEADRRARGIVAGKKAATVERPGSASGGRNPRLNAKNREEAMNMVAEAIRNGRPVPEFDEIGG